MPLQKGPFLRNQGLSGTLKEVPGNSEEPSRGLQRSLQGLLWPFTGVLRARLFLKELRAIKKKFSKTSALEKGGSKRPLALCLIQGEVCRNFGILRLVSLLFGGFRQWNWGGKAV